MKKLLVLLLLLVTALFSLASCGGSDKDGDDKGPTSSGNGQGGNTEEPENFIYNKTSKIYLVFDTEELSEEQINKIMDAFFAAEIYIQPASKDAEPMAHEIVIGDVGRAVSNQAYTQLERIDKNTSNDLRYCFYSDGSSLAMAYDEDNEDYAFYEALSCLAENYILDELVLPKGAYSPTRFDLYEYLDEKDAAIYTQKWADVASALGEENKDVLVALQQLYTIMDGEGLITWVSNLYDPDICVCRGYLGEEECRDLPICHTGGFYFSNSARDTFGYLPDIESTLQGLNLIGSSGIADGIGGGYKHVVPDWMAKQIVDFTYNLQDPDGYFYHPQWGKSINTSRRGRDLTWSMNILNNYDVETKYPTIYDVSATASPLPAKLGSSTVVAASKVILCDGETLIPDYLKTPEAFKKFLDAQDIRNNSYSVGSNLSATGDQIVARGPEYGEILINWLNENQYENGTWHHTLNYAAINGVMKITGSYSRWKAPIPNAEATVRASFAAIDTEEEAKGIVDVWNAWVAANNVLSNIKSYGENGEERAAEIRESLMPLMDEAILATREKLLVFLKPDGSMNYNSSGKSSGVSMGAKVCPAGIDEGDLNATLIGTTNMTQYIFSFLSMAKYEVPVAQTKERAMFLDIVNNLSPVNKGGGTLEIGDPFDFEDYAPGDDASDVTNTGSGPLFITEDPRGSGNVAQLVSTPGSGDSISISCQGSDKNITGIVFESDICINSADKYDSTLRLELGDIGDESNNYRINFKPTSDSIEIFDSSANIASKRMTNYLATVKYGEWFKLRVEYYFGDHDTVRIKVYFNGKLLAISDNYYDNSGSKLVGKGTPKSKSSVARFYVLKDYSADMMVDNIICYKSNTEYKAEQLHEDYRYEDGAINVDNYSPDGLIYGFDDLEEGSVFPPEFKVNTEMGSAEIKSEGDNKYLSVSGGASVSVPYVKRSTTVNSSTVSFNILPMSYTVGDTVDIRFVAAGKDAGELFSFSLKVEEDKYSLVETKNGTPISGVSIPRNKSSNLKITYYDEMDVVLIYVDGERVGAYDAPETPLNFGRITLSSKADATAIDDLVVEKSYNDFLLATAPKIEEKIYGFDNGLEDIEVTGRGASVVSSKLVLVGNSSSTELKVPILERDPVVGYAGAGFDLLFVQMPKVGVTHTLALTDRNGARILALTLKYDGKTIGIYETTEQNVYSYALAAFDPTTPVTFSFEYYIKEGVCKIYLDGEYCFTTAILYSSDASSLSPEYFSIKTGGAVSNVNIDDLFAEKYNKFYQAQKPTSNPEDNETVITFDGSGASSLPKTLTTSIFSTAPDMTVVEKNKGDGYDKVLRFETAPGPKMDSLIIKPTKKQGNVKSYVFEGEMMLESGDKDVTYQFDFWSSNAKTVQINIGIKDGNVFFRHQDHLGKKGSVDIAKPGEWFKMRAEYYTVTDGGVTDSRMKLYINDELIYVTNMRLSSKVCTTIDYVGLNALLASTGVIYLDNISFVQSSEAYDGAPLTEDFTSGTPTPAN